MHASTTVEGSQTCGLGHLLAIAAYEQVQCREPKTGQKKVQFYCEDDSYFLSSYYLSMFASVRQRPKFSVCRKVSKIGRGDGKENKHPEAGK